MSGTPYVFQHPETGVWEVGHTQGTGQMQIPIMEPMMRHGDLNQSSLIVGTFRVLTLDRWMLYFVPRGRDRRHAEIRQVYAATAEIASDWLNGRLDMSDTTRRTPRPERFRFLSGDMNRSAHGAGDTPEDIASRSIRHVDDHQYNSDQVAATPTKPWDQWLIDANALLREMEERGE